MKAFEIVLCSLLILFSLMRPSNCQITKQNENYCYDDPRVMITGVIGSGDNRSVAKFAGKERFGDKYFYGSIQKLSNSLLPILNPLKVEEGKRQYQYDYFKIKKPYEVTIAVHDFLYFREIMTDYGNKYRLLGFVQSWLGCPEPLCFSATLDAANLLVENELTVQKHVFRGAFVWDITVAVPLIERATAISDRFPGMPSHIDAAVSLGIESDHILEMFIFKDEFVYHSINNDIPRIHRLINIFPEYKHSSVQAAYVDRYDPHSVTKIYLFYENEVSVYNYGSERFTRDSETILTQSLTNIEAAFTIYDSSNLDNSYVFVFKSWTCTRIGYKSLNLPGFDPEKYKTENTIKTEIQFLSFEYPFNCTSQIDLYKQLHWGIEDYESFKELYINKLRSVHTKKDWIYIKYGGRKARTILLARKLKRMELSDMQITRSKIEAGKITPLQLLEAGIATPSMITGAADSAILSATSSATPRQYKRAGHTWSQLNESGIKTSSAITKSATPSTLLQMGYSPSQLIEAGIVTSSKIGVKEASPSMLLQIGYSPSQLVDAGVTTPSRFGTKVITPNVLTKTSYPTYQPIKYKIMASSTTGINSALPSGQKKRSSSPTQFIKTHISYTKQTKAISQYSGFSTSIAAPSIYRKRAPASGFSAALAPPKIVPISGFSTAMAPFKTSRVSGLSTMGNSKSKR
ncbi:hypothetical protein B4U79_17951 [Dinothrombium tinctorium]|uniref:Uncharacterized protein n=1 Tax=Dinothrombium tinctorium TaxID=1965070 RepID=A0A3S3PPP1_9ACAR|nr:hypothetical protein B4U79_17951 [Dinothrombium tinctorium]